MKPLLSIVCIAYNQANYICQCLDGFVMQKTNFKFEVLIHDDASTDGTADIIREYEIDIIGETKLRIKVDDVAIDQMIDTNYMKDVIIKRNKIAFIPRSINFTGTFESPIANARKRKHIP